MSIDPEDDAAISRLLTEFYWRLDHRGGAGLSELFIEGGRFILPGRTFATPKEFEQWATERGSNGAFVSRHLWSNLRVSPAPEGRARAEGNVMIFLRREKCPALIVGNFVDLIQKGNNGGWRFVERRAHSIYEGELPAEAAR